MSTYSDHEQRLLDQQSGAELDRIAERHARTVMFRPKRMYGEPYDGNGDPEGVDGFYFTIEGANEDVGGSLSGYLSREQFNWLAERIGTPVLP
jgi:hypothetical protein